jgi:chromosomal replication initiator protein
MKISAYAIPGLKIRGPLVRQQIDALFITTVVCRHYDVSEDILYTRSRIRTNILPRQVAIYLLRHNTTMSLEDIGRVFKKSGHGFHHTTIIHTCRHIQNLMDTDPEIHHDVKTIQELIS